MELNKIIQGDSLEELKKLPDESIDCVITSPPYWGLRDYGTGKWEGGSESCEHRRMSKKSDKTITGHKNFDDMLGVGDAIQKDICNYCGAKRIDQQLGLEKTPEEYVAKLVEIFSEVKRVLKKEGTLWLNLGDSYANAKVGNTNGVFAGTHKGKLLEEMEFKKELPEGLKQKDLVGIPWRVAFALQADGWYLRQDIIWAKPNPMPESVTDRCTKSHEYIFLLAKSPKYYFDNEAIMEKATTEIAERKRVNGQSVENGKKSGHQRNCGVKMATPFLKGQQAQVRENHNMHYDERETYGQRNKRSVWTVTTKPFAEAHFATFPEDLIGPMVKAGCPKEVCKKCGKGRESVIEKETSYDESKFDRGGEGVILGRNKNPHGGLSSNWEPAKIIDKGLTDCGCNAGFSGGIVMDIFMGAGTTAWVAKKLGRNFLGIELNPEYIKIAESRIRQEILI